MKKIGYFLFLVGVGLMFLPIFIQKSITLWPFVVGIILCIISVIVLGRTIGK